eukprot:2059350-Rhodomonas_salina.1
MSSKALIPGVVLDYDMTKNIYDSFYNSKEEMAAIVGTSCGTAKKVIVVDNADKFPAMHNQMLFVRAIIVATITVAAVIFSVLGTVTMLGWSVGTLEAIAITLLSGFSVDYILHLASSIHHGDVEQRKAKNYKRKDSLNQIVVTTLNEVTISMFHGMTTSICRNAKQVMMKLKLIPTTMELPTIISHCLQDISPICATRPTSLKRIGRHL